MDPSIRFFFALFALSGQIRPSYRFHMPVFRKYFLIAMLLTSSSFADLPDSETVYNGESGLWLKNEHLEVFVTAEKRIRVLALRRPGHPNLLAESDSPLCGIRTWLMVPFETPDLRDEVASLSGSLHPQSDGSLHLVSALSPVLNLRLEWRLRLDPDQPRLWLEHQITNFSKVPLQIGLWSLFGFAEGTRLCIPLEASCPRPSFPRLLYHFPFSDLNDPRLRFFANRLELDLRSGQETANLKVGSFARSGLGLARVGDTVLVSRVEVKPEKPYPEGGPNLTVYATPAQVPEPKGELEHMDALHDLQPVESSRMLQVIHLEPAHDSPTWETLQAAG